MLFQILAFTFVLFLSISWLEYLRKAWMSPSAPGPALARWTGLWYVSKVYQGTFEKWNIAQHAAHGKIVRVAPNKYSIDDPEACKLIYGANTPFLKTEWYSMFGDPFVGPNDNLFSIQDHQLHAAMRRRQAAFFSMTSIKHYEPYVNECVEIFLQQFDRRVKSGETLDLQRWLQCYAYDAISQITFGTRHGFVDSGARDPDGTILWLWNTVWMSTLAGLMFPWGLPFILLKFGIPTAGISKFIGRLEAQAAAYFATRIVDEETENDRPATFYEKLLKSKKANPEDFEKYRVFITTQANMIAGSDTTGIALTAIMIHLLQHRDVLEKLRTELKDAERDGNLSYPVTFDETQKLPYLQYIIKEAMRMHPPVGLPMWRLVPAGGMEIAGKHFPARTWVGINPWVAHRNADVFGSDANVFKPGRWDPSVTSKEQLHAMESYTLTFGNGSRTCNGKNISILEINKLIPELVRRFDFELLESSSDIGSKTENNWFVKQRETMVRIRAT